MSNSVLCEWQFAVAIILYINVETKWQESLAAHMVQLMNPVPGVTCLSSGLPSNVLLRQINLMNPWVPPCFAIVLESTVIYQRYSLGLKQRLQI